MNTSNRELPVWLYPVFFLVAIVFFVLGLIMLLKPEVMAEWENKNTFWMSVVATDEEKESNLRNLWRIRLQGALCVSFMGFLVLRALDVIH